MNSHDPQESLLMPEVYMKNLRMGSILNLLSLSKVYQSAFRLIFYSFYQIVYPNPRVST